MLRHSKHGGQAFTHPTSLIWREYAALAKGGGVLVTYSNVRFTCCTAPCLQRLKRVKQTISI
jgi:hypothetical protein